VTATKRGPGGARKQGVKPCSWCGADFLGFASAKRCEQCVGVGTERMRWNQSIALYGVDKFMYEAMYFEQDGTCLICQEREAKCLDHDHETGRPRGLLCLGCNTLLGFIETPGRLDSALDYLSQAGDFGGGWS